LIFERRGRLCALAAAFDPTLAEKPFENKSKAFFSLEINRRGKFQYRFVRRIFLSGLMASG